MSGKTRSQCRELRGEIAVYPAETSLGWRVIRHVPATEAREKLATGEWREVYDEHQSFLGCQILANFKVDQELPSGASSTSITVRECLLNAGIRETSRGVVLGLKSRTAGMTEDERISRKNKFGKPLPPEDAVERARAKVKELAKLEHRILAPIKVVDVDLPSRPWDAFREFASVAG